MRMPLSYPDRLREIPLYCVSLHIGARAITMSNIRIKHLSSMRKDSTVDGYYSITITLMVSIESMKQTKKIS